MFGKVGRAETATDPAPMEMIETTIQFKPRDEWRPGMTTAKLIEELDRTVQVPGLSNIWVPPIRNRIDMLATGIKSPVGIKVSGPIPPPSTACRRRSSARSRTCPASRRRSPSGSQAAAISTSTSTGGRGALRTQHRRRAGDDRRRGRRREHRRDGRGARPVPHQRALSARAARLGRGAADAAHRHRARRAAAALGDRDGAHRRRPADAQERERAAHRLGLRGRARARPRVGGARCAGGGGARREAAARLFGVVVRPVRVPGAREGAARLRRAVDARHDLRAALSCLPAHRRGAPHHARGSVRAGRRLLAAVGARATRRRSRRRSGSSRWRASRPNSAS